MSCSISFVGAGVGDMAVIDCDDGSVILHDCLITKANKAGAVPSLFAAIDSSRIDVFIASNVDEHRVAGLSNVAERFQIGKIWDGAVPFETDFPAFNGYSALRTQL